MDKCCQIETCGSKYVVHLLGHDCMNPARGDEARTDTWPMVETHEWWCGQGSIK